MSKYTPAALVAELQAILAQGPVSELDPPCPMCKHEAYGEQGRARKRRYLAILKPLFEAVAKELGQKGTAKINMAGPLMPGDVRIDLEGGVAELVAGGWEADEIQLRIKCPHPLPYPAALSERVYNTDASGTWIRTGFVVSTVRMPIPLASFENVSVLALDIRKHIAVALAGPTESDAPDTTKESEVP